MDLLDSMLLGNKPSLPPELRAVVLEAANDLKAAQTAIGSDSREFPETIVSRLKSVLAISHPHYAQNPSLSDIAVING